MHADPSQSRYSSMHTPLFAGKSHEHVLYAQSAHSLNLALHPPSRPPRGQ